MLSRKYLSIGVNAMGRGMAGYITKYVEGEAKQLYGNMVGGGGGSRYFFQWLKYT
jgi:hypothetical protein